MRRPDQRVRAQRAAELRAAADLLDPPPVARKRTTVRRCSPASGAALTDAELRNLARVFRPRNTHFGDSPQSQWTHLLDLAVVSRHTSRKDLRS